MKIFPLRLLSQMDKAQNLLRIVSGEYPPIAGVSHAGDTYVKDAIKATSELKINPDNKLEYTIDTKEVASRMTFRNYLNNLIKKVYNKGE